jgi:carbon storage regulator
MAVNCGTVVAVCKMDLPGWDEWISYRTVPRKTEATTKGQGRRSTWMLLFKEEVMLVLSRKVGESIVIDGDIKISVSSVQGGRVKLCIEAPREKRVSRAELDAVTMPAVLRDVRETRSSGKSVPQLAGM